MSSILLKDLSKLLLWMLIFLSPLLPGLQFLIVREAHGQNAPVKNCPTGQTVWTTGANVGKCVQYYCGPNGDHDHDGNCIPCSSGKYYENGGSCTPRYQVSCQDIKSQIEKDIDPQAISLGKQAQKLNDDSSLTKAALDLLTLKKTIKADKDQIAEFQYTIRIMDGTPLIGPHDPRLLIKVAIKQLQQDQAKLKQIQDQINAKIDKINNLYTTRKGLEDMYHSKKCGNDIDPTPTDKIPHAQFCLLQLRPKPGCLP